MRQLTADTATRTIDLQIFASRKSAVNGQWSVVSCPSTRGFTPPPTFTNERSVFWSFISRKNRNHQTALRKKLVGGFTLVETLVAISILLIAVVGPISLIGDSLHKLYYAKDEMVAINLAQEGIEVVRQVRDSNMLANTGNTWKDLHAGTKQAYTIDTIKFVSGDIANNFMIKCNSCVPQPIFRGSASGIYSQVTTGPAMPATQFSRIVEIDKVVSNNYEKIVTSTVTWQTGGETGTISVSENIFDLKK